MRSFRAAARGHRVAGLHGMPGLLALVAGTTVVALLGAGLVAVLRPGRPTAPALRSGDVPVAMAAAFVAGVVTADEDLRARTVGALVVPDRVPEFVAAIDAVVEPRVEGGALLSATPRSFKVVESSDTVRVVLVWAEVSTTRAAGPVDGPGTSWEVWGIGLMRTGALWQVFSYEGTREGVPPGDPRLEGFSELVA